MTGRELILYILENKLEDEPVFKDGAFVGFETAGSCAVRNNVGLATIQARIGMGTLDAVYVDSPLIPIGVTKEE